ncbi:MAG: hypothetical protein ACXWLM_05460 [Myxococcales bacterium]
MQLRSGKFAAGSLIGLSAAVVSVLFAFGVPEQQGCGGGSDLGDADLADVKAAAMCAQQHAGKTHEGESVVVCDQPFAGAPRVKLPADTRTTLYLAFESNTRDAMWVDRSGVEYVASGATPAHMPSNRNLYLIYQVTGTVGTKDNQPSLHVTSAKPAVLLEGKAIDGAVTVWEGTVTRRTSASAWDWNATVPLRITIGSSKPALRGLPVWGDTGKILADGPVLEMEGAIDNWYHAVRDSKGKCYPALTGMDKANPFAGAKSGHVALYRMATMHFAGDQVMVLEYPQGTTGLSQNGMGGITVLHPAAFIQTGTDPRWHVQQFRPHSAPNGNIVELRPASGGGGGC